MLLTSRVSDFGLVEGQSYWCVRTDLNCVRVTMPTGNKITVSLVHFDEQENELVCLAGVAKVDQKEQSVTIQPDTTGDEYYSVELSKAQLETLLLMLAK